MTIQASHLEDMNDAELLTFACEVREAAAYYNVEPLRVMQDEVKRELAHREMDHTLDIFYS